MFVRSSPCFIPSEGLKGVTGSFIRKNIEKTAEEFDMSLKRVEKALEIAMKENPGKEMVIVFSQFNKEPPILMVEESDAYYKRLISQMNRAGIRTSAPI